MKVFLASIALLVFLSCATRAGSTGGVSGFVFDLDKPLVGVDVFVAPLTGRNESIHDARPASGTHPFTLDFEERPIF